MTDNELEAAAESLVAEMNRMAGVVSPLELPEPPSFTWEPAPSGVRILVHSDNGGGSETSHPTVTTAELTREGDDTVRLWLETTPTALRGLTVSEAAQRARGFCLRFLGFASSDNAPPEAYVCPFCESIATEPFGGNSICANRQCVCGAVMLGAPAVDMDEIIDDAIQIFGVRTKATSRGYDAQLLQDVRDAGVEVRDGWEGGREGGFSRFRMLWFRRRSVGGSG